MRHLLRALLSGALGMALAMSWAIPPAMGAMPVAATTVAASTAAGISIATTGTAQDAATSGRFLIRRADPKAADVEADAVRLGAKVVRRSRRGAFSVVRLPKGADAARFVQRLKQDLSVLSVEPDRIVHALLTPNDPGFPGQWGLTRIGAPTAWNTTTGNSTVTIAVLDTGVMLGHPDLSARIDAADQYDFANNDAVAADDDGHGTHVSGIAAATMNNGIDGAGVAPSSRIMPVKVLDASGSGNLSNVVDGIYWAADHKAAVINMSFGYTGAADPSLQQAVSYAVSKGVVLVAAAGNDGTYTKNEYPAACSGVIAVAATESGDSHSSYSNSGPYVDVAAPGSNIRSTTFDGGFDSMSGTSMASPFVAGLAALVKTRNPSFTPDQVAQRIEKTAVDLGTSGRDDTFGYGRIDAAAAVGSATAPKALTARFSNPVAYELKSLLTTRFHASVDSPNVWAVLTVSCPSGPKTLYDGPIGAANQDFVFPAWNGTDAKGNRLTSSSYDWQLTVTKGGASSTTTGKITVSRIFFTMKGRSSAGAVIHHQGYMIPGSANFYVGATTTRASDSLRITVNGPNHYNATVGDFGVVSASRLNTTAYLRGVAAIRSRAVHDLYVTSAGDVTYGVTVIQ